MKSCINYKERYPACQDNCSRHKNDIKEERAIKDKQRKFEDVMNFENRLKSVYGIVYGYGR